MSIITVFGSSDVKPVDPDYQIAFDLGKSLATAGFDIASGGYGGIMEAVHKGASDFSIRRIGILTDDLSKREPNSFINEIIKTKDYLERLKSLVNCGSAYIAFNGSWGTMLELTTVIALSERSLLKGKTLICVSGKWRQIIDTINEGKVISNLNIFYENNIDNIIKLLKTNVANFK